MRTCVCVVVAVVLCVVEALPDRQLSNSEVNPGCKGDECDEPWVVVTAGINANNTLHHLWGTRGALSFLVAAGTGGPNITVNWDDLRNNTDGSITFIKDPTHVFGFAIPNLILYNDTHDDGAYQDQDTSLRIPTSDFTWSAKVLKGSSHHQDVEIQPTHFQGDLLPNDTKILIKVSAYGKDGRSSLLPHLLYTPDSAQFDLILDNLNISISDEIDSWPNKRWGMDVVLFTSEHLEKKDKDDFGLKFHTQKSLDDEHTPGVFDLDQVTSAGARDGSDAGGYIQWRPVSYLTPKREIEYATTPNINTSLPALTNLTDAIKSSLAYAVLGEKLKLPDAAVTSVISFGQPKDGFYKADQYTTWTVGMGEGSAPKETFSTLVVVVISVCVVLPCAFFVVGFVVLAVRRFRRRRRQSSLLE